MSGAKVPALLTVLAGNFHTQPDAFAFLLQEAGRYGLTFDLADVDVIQSARPEMELVFRNLGFSGDTVSQRPRLAHSRTTKA